MTIEFRYKNVVGMKVAPLGVGAFFLAVTSPGSCPVLPVSLERLFLLQTWCLQLTGVPLRAVCWSARGGLTSEDARFPDFSSYSR